MLRLPVCYYNCMYLNLKKVMETALASTISLRAIGGGVKIGRANHERADPNCLT